ncbi:Divalent metal cation transporter MntH [Tetrabaena socialis]|uniref:Divalent metal cation transporter MntH n=1 Tax=Tetrabaena socialis TaxID=47790 RepID=A0A2J8AJ28_9CHLO|nr:Divalent metal cation transporter MntH [Tetrabaena socialis]|eukprot:PNH12513.1 Divalent metal cation transporter MntH [Tetrabaena socialis]
MKSGLSMTDAFRIMGPAFLVSVALVDPGNWATAIEAGSRFGYELVWVVVASNLIAILLQTLAARLGIVSGKHLAQVCALLWVLCEISIVALDLTMLLVMPHNFYLHSALVSGQAQRGAGGAEGGGREHTGRPRLPIAPLAFLLPYGLVTPAAALPGAWAADALAQGSEADAWAGRRAPEAAAAAGTADEAAPWKRQRHSGDGPQQQSWWGGPPTVELTPVPAPSPAPFLRHSTLPHSSAARRSGASLEPDPDPPPINTGGSDAGSWLPFATDPAPTSAPAPAPPPATPMLNCWCLFGPAVLVSFGVWCSFTLVQWCGAESRPELWGRYAAVLNKLQGVLWDARLDVAAAGFAQQEQQGPAAAANVGPVGRVSSGGIEGGRAGAWGSGSPQHHHHYHHRSSPQPQPQPQQPQQQQPQQQPQRAAGGQQACLPPTALRLCPEHLALLRWELLQQLATLEGGLGERHGPADTAAGDVAFPKGKEIIASVMRRYKRRLGGGGGGGAAAAAGGGAGPVVGLWGGASAALRAAVLPSIVSLATVACVVLLLPPAQQRMVAAHGLLE